ncbi:MAG: CRISPR-associated helicase Cas3' [Christensenellaceae bacterium]
MNYLAHTKDGKTFTSEEECQLLQVHLLNVAQYCASRACFFGGENLASAMGLLHDLGKYNEKFQQRIRGKAIKYNHMCEGACVLQEIDPIANICAMVVACHHGGLKNRGNVASKADNSYFAKMNDYERKHLESIAQVPMPTAIVPKQFQNYKHMGFLMSMYVRMQYSVLIDSDWTDTQEFCSGIKIDRKYATINELWETAQKNLPKNDGSKINTIRAEVLKQCISSAKKPQGLFTLTVPTGGGKTLSSLHFALNHAKEHGLRRIIYVIPFTSIIEQNAKVLSDIFGKENVLEHHTHVIMDGLSEEEQEKLRFASETWDIPIIVTTNVQFFESLYAVKSSKLRKIHNISSSVVIFDEAQTIPREYLSPCLYAVSELIANYKVSAVLCSATQPEIERFQYKGLKAAPIIEDANALFESLKRTEYELIGEQTNEQLIQLVACQKNALVVLNSRKHAYTLYQKSSQSESVFHLSTLMTPLHRSAVIKEIKERLENGKETIVFSTQLIEAGVNIDFSCVFRSLAGIDSIIQAGGRANREGRQKSGKVYVFKPNPQETNTPKAIQPMISIAEQVIRVNKEHAFDLEGIHQYFDLLYDYAQNGGMLDKENILSEFERVGNEFKLNFADAAKKFKFIKEDTYQIIVQTDKNCEKLVKEIKDNTFTKDTLRKLQQYCVSVYKNEFEKMESDHVLEKLSIDSFVLNNLNYYDKKTGLKIFTDENLNAQSYLI